VRRVFNILVAGVADHGNTEARDGAADCAVAKVDKRAVFAVDEVGGAFV